MLWLIIYVEHFQIIVIVEEICYQILTDLYVFSTNGYEKVAFESPLPPYAYMHMRPGSTSVGRYNFVIFSSQEFFHPRSVPGEYKRSSSKNCGLLIGPSNTKLRYARKWI